MKFLSLIVLSLFSISIFAENDTALIDPNKSSVEVRYETNTDDNEQCMTARATCDVQIVVDGNVISSVRLVHVDWSGSDRRERALRSAIESFNRDLLTAKTQNSLLRIRKPSVAVLDFDNINSDNADTIEMLTRDVAIQAKPSEDRDSRLAVCQETLMQMAANMYNSEVNKVGEMQNLSREISSQVVSE